MKKLTLLLIFLISTNVIHARYNNAYKIYGMIGTGLTSVGFGGGGFSYTGEWKYHSDSSFLQGFTIDLQMMGLFKSMNTTKIAEHLGLLDAGIFYLDYTPFELNTAITYSLGWQTLNGHKFLIDIIGVGINYIKLQGEHQLMGMITILGIQSTYNNGLYIAWRSNISILSSIKNWETQFNTAIQNNTDFIPIEWKTYIALGYDFGKIANPRAYTRVGSW